LNDWGSAIELGLAEEQFTGPLEFAAEQVLNTYAQEDGVRNEAWHDLEMLVKVLYYTRNACHSRFPAVSHANVAFVNTVWAEAMSCPPWSELVIAARGSRYAEMKRLIVQCFSLPSLDEAQLRRRLSASPQPDIARTSVPVNAVPASIRK
jgi:hypothetical protein